MASGDQSAASMHKTTLYQLSESSPVRLSLAIAFCVGVWYMATALASLRSEIARDFVSKELFSVRMNQIETQLRDVQSEIKDLREELRASPRNDR